MRVVDLASLVLFAVGASANIIPDSKRDGCIFGGKKWVVLVAGSEGWNNYRHQADICHAYQIIKANGIPEENIITMMVDDIANNTKNPTPGMIINKPYGDDVYKGVVIDYKGENVTKSNFLKIITGDKAGMQSIGTGKVVQGGPFDRIFINYVDHGTTGILGFPDDYLYADELNDAFYSMNANATYKKILLYVEACKAGSMFDGILSEDANILAVTASGPRENSYGCYCKSQSGPYKTCLGDLFSVTWMEDLDAVTSKHKAKKRTVFNDFRVVRTNVTQSNVMIYGELQVGNDKLSSFIGYRGNDNAVDSPPAVQRSNAIDVKNTASSRDVHESDVLYKLAQDKLPISEALQLSAEFRQNKKMRSVIDSVLRNIYSEVVKARPDVKREIGDFDEPNYLKLNLAMFPCYRSILNQITESCFSLPRNPYVLDRLTLFANMCVVDKEIQQMVGSIVVKSCSNTPKNIVNVQ